MLRQARQGRQTTLDQLADGRRAAIVEIQGGHRLVERLGELGLHPGDEIEVLRKGFFGGPVLVEIHGVTAAIGQGEARKILVEEREA